METSNQSKTSVQEKLLYMAGLLYVLCFEGNYKYDYQQNKKIDAYKFELNSFCCFDRLYA